MLPSVPPTPELPYTGAQTTGATRASLQRALDNYKTGHINLPPQLAASELSRSDTRSFGESHARELSALAAASPMPAPSSPQQSPAPVAKDVNLQSPVIDCTTLNNSPAPIPIPSRPTVISDPSLAPPATPTIAETGIPVTAGEAGPGPASGSLRDLHSFPSPGPISQHSPASRTETAEEEKRRLASAYSTPEAGQSQPLQAPPAAYESAEEEKKRLEKEARERLLHQASSQPHQDKQDGDDELPPYQDI